MIFGSDLPRIRPNQGVLGPIWDLGSYIGRPGVLAAVTFAAYLLGSVAELNPLRLWEHGGRPPWINSILDRARRNGRLDRLRIVPISLQAREDVNAFTAAELGIEPAPNPKSYRMPTVVLYESRQLATRLQAANAELFGRYDRLLAESALRLNIVPPLMILGLAIAWLLPQVFWLRIVLSATCVAFGLTLLRQAVICAIESTDVPRPSSCRRHHRITIARPDARYREIDVDVRHTLDATVPDRPALATMTPSHRHGECC